MRYHFLLVAIALAIAGCDRPKTEVKEASLSETLPDLILPANASFVSRSGGEDAVSVTLRTPQKLEAVADWYRTRLSAAPWHIESDSKDGQGVVSLYATRQGPPMWVRISPDSEYNATLVQLTGASLKNAKVGGVGTQIAPAGKPVR